MEGDFLLNDGDDVVGEPVQDQSRWKLEKHDAKDEDKPRRGQAFQGYGDRENCLFKIKRKPYFDQKDHKKKADVAQVPYGGQDQQRYGETSYSLCVIWELNMDDHVR